MAPASSPGPRIDDRLRNAGVMRWWPWILGAALLGTVVIAGLHLSEGHAFLELARHAIPLWVGLALICQVGTYIAQGDVWRAVARAAHVRLSRVTAFELSLAKLFIDQSLPSAGISSSVLVATALDHRQMPRGAAMATVAINLASYHAAYVIGLMAAMAIAIANNQTNALVVSLATVFTIFSVALTTGVLLLAGRPTPAVLSKLKRFAPVRGIAGFLEDADPGLIRNRRLLVRTTAAQLAIIFFDAATLWTLIRSLHVVASPGGVLVSFMVSSLFRTMGVVPGGLGTFEASAVLTLRMMGLTIPVALSATLLFRGVSFWLPMVPGWWCSRRVIASPRIADDRTAALAYWSTPVDELLKQVGSSPSGLSSEEAERRLLDNPSGDMREHWTLSRTRVFLRQLRSPLLWLLMFAVVISIATREWSDATIVLSIVVATVVVGYFREYGAERAVAALRSRVHTTAIVLRDGVAVSVPRGSIVIGDVVRLSAGSLVPADAVVLEASDCFVTEGALTGESFPVQKIPGVASERAGLAERPNCVFLGTNVRSGTAHCLVVATGGATELARIAKHLTRKAPETDFDRGMRRFGYLLTGAMLVLVLIVFVAHMLRGRAPVETLLFSVALAVGLSPELLPAILSVNLARGAQMMARRGVLVRRLNAIENLGSMNVLCTDKTGTLTEGIVRLEGAYDADGISSQAVLDVAAINAGLQTGLANPLDEAILDAHRPDVAAMRKLAEIPFDFVRKRLSVVVDRPGGPSLITKGAFASVLSVCTHAADGTLLDPERVARITARYEAWSHEGIRVLALATRPIAIKPAYERADEVGLSFAGFVTFLDRPKDGVTVAVKDLERLGVSLKLITGDNHLVARHVAGVIGMNADRILTGSELDELDNAALWRLAPATTIFAEVDPNQKERIILALRKAGFVVGFLGDGINDAPAMHAADTSLSVDQAVDVARETADFVLLERDLDVIRGGIEEGRRTFANTLKYILTTTSANLGNMISMAAASLMLPFLPLLAGQILLNNLLSDVPAIGIADDRVDPEMIERPPRWDIRFIGRFMAEFGLVSSAFDFLTFGVLLWTFHASVELFRTGWFVESLLTELAIALVVRTRRPFFMSRPGALLLVSSLVMMAITLLLPFVPIARLVGLVPVPANLLGAMGLITALYVGATELLKLGFYRSASSGARRRAAD
jgi:P-type Mg2+ transporter